MNFRQADEDPFIQAHPAPDRTQPCDSARRDMLVAAVSIVALMVLAVLSSALRAPR